MKSKIRPAFLLGFIVLLLSILTTSFPSPVIAQVDPVVYQNTLSITINDANAVAVWKGQLRITNVNNGTAHTYSFTGGSWSGNGFGNATNYKIECIYQGTKTGETTITTSATAGSTDSITLTCSIYKLEFTLKDFYGKEFTAEKVEITAPNGTTNTFTNVKVWKAGQNQNGSWTIKAYVSPTSGISWLIETKTFSLTANKVFDYDCKEFAYNIAGTGFHIWADNLADPTEYVWDSGKKFLITRGSVPAGTYVYIKAYVGDEECRDVYAYAGSLISWKQVDKLVEATVTALTPIDVAIDLSKPGIPPPVKPPPLKPEEKAIKEIEEKMGIPYELLVAITVIAVIAGLVFAMRRK